MDDKSDLLSGLEAIAGFLNVPRRRAKHWHEKGLLPTFKIIDIVCARRSSLAAWLAEREAAGRNGEG